MGSKEAAEATYKAFRAKEFAGSPGPGRQISEEERQGVSPIDPSPEPPLGVGVSPGRNAEDVAREEPETGRRDEGSKGRSERPVGTSTSEQSTGVNPEAPIDPESPTQPRSGG
ncbi:MAG TPA: hypothetical protein VGP03_10270 [Pseudonocardiaceae bacterium]|jgi:hypothetical protein|nr:hypothetical protein [Pseudonocardiaceae bacterium]